MIRRNLFKSLACLPFAGSLAEKANGGQICGIDLSSGYSFRFSDGCIDQDEVDIASFSQYKDRGKTFRSIEFYKKAPNWDVLSHEEECPHLKRPHYHTIGPNGACKVEDTFLYKNGRRVEEYSWKISTISYINGIEIGIPEPGCWLRYHYESVI